jgi:hypothetical protein
MLVHPSIDISYTDAFYFPDQNPNSLYKTFVLSNEAWIPKFEKMGIEVIEYLLENNIAPVNSMLIKKEIFEKVGSFNPLYKSLEDWEFWMRCAFAEAQFTWFENREAYALVRVHSESMTHNNNRMNFYFIKYLTDISKMLRFNKCKEHQLLLIQNKRQIDIKLRCKIREIGLTNIKLLKKVASTIGWLRFFKLYIKELNLLRKNRTCSANY